MDLHVPVTGEFRGPVLMEYLTKDLDAVIVGHEMSKVYPGNVHFVLAGNPRDLAIAAERSSKLGGVVD